MVNSVHVDGTETVKVFIYTLSTCGWCRKTKEYLKELGVAYDYVDIDGLMGTDLEETLTELKKWNPSQSFPTLVIDGKTAILGFQPDSIKAAVGM